MSDQEPIDMGYLSLPVDIQDAVDEEASRRLAESPVADGVDQFLANPQSGVVRLRPSSGLDPIVHRLRDERRRRRRAEDKGSRRWTQAWVAQHLGVKQPTVGMWELGRNVPALAQLRAWAALFDLDLTLITRVERKVA